ncbi:MAG: thioredoxin [Bacilli bacterium]|nr:thioredoxin [Bacilli bacterium]
MIKHVKTNAEFEEAIAKGEVLVDFWATWCGPCRMLAPVLEEVGAEHPELTIVKVDVDEASDLAAKFGISSIPTLIRFQDGKIIDKTLGFMPKPKLLAFLGR